MRNPAAEKGPWIACLAALPIELAGLSRQMKVDGTGNQSGVQGYWGRIGERKVLLAQTGMGREFAQRATKLILDQNTVAALINFGFAGALSNQLEAGALVLCRELYHEDGTGGQAPVCSDAGLLAAAQALRTTGKTPILGSSLTVGRVVSRPEEKHALAAAYPAEVLEMESYWIGKECAERGVAFLAVRAVSDTVGQDLPRMEGLLGPGGEVHWQAALRRVLTHPAELARLAKFGRTARQAERELTGFLSAFLLS